MDRRVRPALLTASWVGMATTILALSVLAPAALAHGGEAGVEVIPSRVAAGDAVRIVGDDFEAGDVIRLALLTGEGDMPLGEAMTDANGHFTLGVDLPTNLDVRPYEVRATDSFGDTASGFLSVVRSAPEASAVPTSAALGLAAIAVAVAAAIGGLTLLRRRRSGDPTHPTENDRQFPAEPARARGRPHIPTRKR